MLLALAHHLNTKNVEDDHLDGVHSQHLKGDEVIDLKMVSYGQSGPSFIKS